MPYSHAQYEHDTLSAHIDGEDREWIEEAREYPDSPVKVYNKGGREVYRETETGTFVSLSRALDLAKDFVESKERGIKW
jgi:hypothetical protein